MTLYNPFPLRFVPIATATFVVAGGAAGWVDTDVSATTGTSRTRLWVIINRFPGYQGCGARAHGETVDNHIDGISVVTLFSYVDSAGHADLYREAGDNQYMFVGYFE